MADEQNYPYPQEKGGPVGGPPRPPGVIQDPETGLWGHMVGGSFVAIDPLPENGLPWQVGQGPGVGIIASQVDPATGYRVFQDRTGWYNQPRGSYIIPQTGGVADPTYAQLASGEGYGAGPGAPNPHGNRGGPSGSIGPGGMALGVDVGGAGTVGPGQGGTAEQRDAFSRLQDTLATYGLGSLARFVWDRIVGGESEIAVLQDLRKTPQYALRFPAMAARQKAGLPAMSEGEYVAYENQAMQMMRAAGLPQGFYDQPTDIARFIGGDVSLGELKARVDTASAAAFTAPAETRAYLANTYGLSSGDLTAYFLDPNRALPLIQRQFTAAQIGGEAARTGYDPALAQGSAEQLADWGISDAQAVAGFSRLGQAAELFAPLPGESGQSITESEQLGAAFGGNVADLQAIDRRRSGRAAVFGGAGDFAADKAGIGGIGSAQGA